MHSISNNRKRFVFQVIRDEIVRTEFIKADSQEMAEKILAESDPRCSYKFLWIQTRTKIEEPEKFIWLHIFLISSTIFLVSGFILLLFQQSNNRYLFFAGLAFLFVAAIVECWRHIRN